MTVYWKGDQAHIEVLVRDESPSTGLQFKVWTYISAVLVQVGSRRWTTITYTDKYLIGVAFKPTESNQEVRDEVLYKLHEINDAVEAYAIMLSET